MNNKKKFRGRYYFIIIIDGLRLPQFYGAVFIPTGCSNWFSGSCIRHVIFFPQIESKREKIFNVSSSSGVFRSQTQRKVENSHHDEVFFRSLSQSLCWFVILWERNSIRYIIFFFKMRNLLTSSNAVYAIKWKGGKREEIFITQWSYGGQKCLSIN